MKFLLDANCWMQMIRRREHADAVQRSIAAVPLNELAISDLSLHSVCIAMGRFGMMEQIPSFLAMCGLDRGMNILPIKATQLARVADSAAANNLDFENACQYVIAELNNLQIISLDADFDRTPRGRLTPEKALQHFKDEQAQT